MECEDTSDALECGAVTRERVRYFTGRHLTAVDFRMEQDYHRSHRYLHNRILHGWGIACGLWVVEHPNEECRKDYVAVKPGIAIDCCGQEITVCSGVASPKVPWDQRPKNAPATNPSAQPAPEGAVPPGSSRASVQAETEGGEPILILCLTFVEKAREKVPVIFDNGVCSDPRSEYSRYEDSFALCWKWINPSDLLKYGWRRNRHSGPKPASPPEPRDDCKPPADCDDSECCQIQCPEGHCTVLAVVETKDNAITGIDMSGRPRVRPAWRHLTHISWYNWPHGGEVTVSWLRRNGLQVAFDREVQPASGAWTGTGINRATFTVRYAGEDEEPNTAPSESGPHMLNNWTALYQVDDRRVHDMMGDVALVTIRCDLILDCHGEPVDGNHLAGLLPTGDGVAGGVFESWFTVVPDGSGKEGVYA